MTDIRHTDTRDPSEETPAPDARPTLRKPGTAARVRRGSFNDGWTEVIMLLADTLTEEQLGLLIRRYKQLTNRGPHGG